MSCEESLSNAENLLFSASGETAMIVEDNGDIERGYEAVKNSCKWVVLYIRTGSENLVLKRLSRRLSGTAYTPFVPKFMSPFTRSGKLIKNEIKPCFPGYVFIKFSCPIEDFFKDVYSLALSIDGAYYFAYYGDDKKDIVIHNEEWQVLDGLLDENFCMAASVGVAEGDRVRVISGALVGKESMIKRIKRNKRKAEIELVVMGDVRIMELSLDVLQKIGDSK